MKRQAQHCVNVLLKELQESDMTYKEMMEVSGFSYFWLIRLIKNLKKEKLVHVCGYYKNIRGQETIKIYRYGKGKDAKRNSLTAAERQKIHRDRKKIQIIPTSLIRVPDYEDRNTRSYKPDSQRLDAVV